MYFSLPKEYREAQVDDLRERIAEARHKLGSRLCILAHHYQRMEVVECGDYVGDSYDLSRTAARQKDAEIIVFCGVHFMAESADILTDKQQLVFLANPLAGCPMADMAEMADVLEAWECLQSFGGADTIMPISYMNTAAGLKAFTGKNGGLICTSSNADAALRWAFERREKVFFFPDEEPRPEHRDQDGTQTGRDRGLEFRQRARRSERGSSQPRPRHRVERPLPCSHQFHR